MPEETPSSPAAPAASASPTSTNAATPLSSFNIGEEFGTAKKNLPPAHVIGIVLGALVVIVAIAAFLLRSKPAGTGAISDVTAVEIADQNSVMVAITLSFHNASEKPFWIRSIKADVETDTGTFSDEAASAADIGRYFEAFPALKQHSAAPLKRRDEIGPGRDGTGTIIVVFPVNQDAFTRRKSVRVSITGDDQPVPIVLTK